MTIDQYIRITHVHTIRLLKTGKPGASSKHNAAESRHVHFSSLVPACAARSVLHEGGQLGLLGNLVLWDSDH